MADADNNYVVGSGKCYFDQFLPGSKTPTGERYFGNTPELSNSQSAETLDHFDADGPAKVKDASLDLSRTTGISFSCDNISTDNLALWWLGIADTVLVAAASATVETFTAKRGAYYQLGQSEALPQGHGGVDTVIVNSPHGVKATGTATLTGVGTANDTLTINGHAITLVAAGAAGAQVNIGASATETAQNLKTYINANSTTLGVKATGNAAILTLAANQGGTAGNADTLAKVSTAITLSGATLTGGATGPVAANGNWEVDLGTGRVQVLEDATDIADDDVFTITYDNDAQTVNQVIAQGNPIYGRFRFISDNRAGLNKDYFYPYVKLTPDGDFSLKGDTWQSITFKGEVLKLNQATDRLYITERGAGD